MIRLTKINKDQTIPVATLTLPFEQRIKSRLRVQLDNGIDAGIFLSRGVVLRDGDLLHSENGYCVRIKAALEDVSTAHSDSPRLISLACYHLGNRHVALEISDNRVRYQADHVLDQMVRGLGLHVKNELAPFEPEAGAYRQHGRHG